MIADNYTIHLKKKIIVIFVSAWNLSSDYYLIIIRYYLF